MEESKRVETAKIEIVVAKWNVRTLAVKGKNDLDHTETLLLHAQTSRCDILYCRRSDGVNRGSLRQLGILYISVVRRRVGTTGSDWLWRSVSWREAGPVRRNPLTNVCSKCS